MPGTVVDLTASSPISAETPEFCSNQDILNEAITKAQPARLKSILLQICHTSVEASRIAERLLLLPGDKTNQKMVERECDSDGQPVSEDEEGDEDEEDEESEGSDDSGSAIYTNNILTPGTSGLKRLRLKYAMCENCGEEFDVATNKKHDCIWHPGRFPGQ